ncbi:ORF67A [Retroperitoneal fibromatosis-associated herpesvirus]|uniref:ORF67A n=1 Tax=Retroperitoneal fibromatosis-associated herpesvirus TaxID=111469 RepID=U5NJ00_9GAMA|nr:ORF67A [Retroperitoneal fibromatosis-associated herpesvirus]AGY30754.1 ORF67A [Retroperitoneal fibromatosis-associated herpesvirus]
MASVEGPDFEQLLPEDLQLMFPTIYARLNALNYCQYLKTFMNLRGRTTACQHSIVLDGKVETVRRVICKIVSADSVYSEVQERA